MFHCHNLIHEDHEMMAAFNVSILPDLGYEETHMLDPMSTVYRAEAQSPVAFQEDSITEKIEKFARLQPYNNVLEAEKKLDEYWATHTDGPTGTTAGTSSSSATQTASTLQTVVRAAGSSTTTAPAAATTTTKAEDRPKTKTKKA